MTVIEAILQSIRNAGSYNKHDLSAPRVILWTDEERLWTQCIEPLRANYPTLWTLGNYDPDNGAGPSAWLRYQLETAKDVPVIYLPGIGGSAFRSADGCPDNAKHLFALQFQGQFWRHKNGKDWTPFAFFSTIDGGLGLDVAGDQDTKKAIKESLSKLLKVDLEELRGRRLEAGDFYNIINDDPVKTLLQWMNDPERIKLALEKSGPEWNSFRETCRSVYKFDPEKDGAITAAEKLISGNPAWKLVWDRFKEVPRNYPGVKKLLESIPTTLFEEINEYKPRLNMKSEDLLEKELLELSSVSDKVGLAKILALADEHAHRSTWVWATLGESPLAKAIVHLRKLAETIQSSGKPNTWQTLADYYSTTGWKADYSVLQALDSAKSSTATKAVSSAIRAVYLPWLEKFAGLTQSMERTYPVTGPQTCRTLPVEDGTVYLFADGLRMDIARCLEERLSASTPSVEIIFGFNWSALPTVTATAKPAWMPLAGKLGGPLEGKDFQAKEQSNGKALIHPRFKQLVEEIGIHFLDPKEQKLANGCAWTEHGSVDTYGHEQGAKLAWRVDEEVKTLQERVYELLKLGWAKVKVITDHGWLMVPGGLPKVDLPRHLTASRWSRCAISEPGAQHGYPMTSWFWDSAEAVVLAPGISCFVAGMEYAHGGLTLQEALIPSLTICAKLDGSAKTVALKEMKWSGLRLNVIFEGAEGLNVDIRSKVADSTSSFIAKPVICVADGHKTSLLVLNDETLGSAAFLVVIDKSGQSIFKHPIVIGEN